MSTYIIGPENDPNAKERFYKAQKQIETWSKPINKFEIPEIKELKKGLRYYDGWDLSKIELRELTRAVHVYILRGWRRSRVARLEVKIAKYLNLEIYKEPRRTARGRKK